MPFDASCAPVKYTTIPIFNLQIPKAVKGVDPVLLDQRNLWTSKDEWLEAAKGLGARFIKNFEGFTDNDEGKRLVAAGPKI